WSDVGSWESLYELLTPEQDPQGNLARGDVILEECSGVFASSGAGRLVACLGMKDCLVVDSPDALLVADRGRGQDIRRIVQALEKRGREELL
ncbi:MAG: mannose-1-phosphate guanylyltransferase/mannose-6-phosphate isomerase, partial [Desulfobacteraceae bacterium]